MIVRITMDLTKSGEQDWCGTVWTDDGREPFYFDTGQGLISYLFEDLEIGDVSKLDDGREFHTIEFKV